MAYKKQNFKNGSTVLTAEMLEKIEDALISVETVADNALRLAESVSNIPNANGVSF